VLKDEADREPALPIGRLMPFDSSERRKTYLLEFPSGAKLRISAVAKKVVELRWRGEKPGAIAAKITAGGDERSVQYVDELLARIRGLEQNGIKQPDPGFGLRTTLFNPSTVTRMGSAFAWAYSKPALVVNACIVIAALLTWFGARPERRAPHLEPSVLAVGYIAYFATLFIHEMGHAAACVRVGGRPGRIGFTIYLIFPALFNDVGAIWSLPRHKRIVVDLGGLYFHSIIAAIFALVGITLHYASLIFAIDLILLTIVLNLNPFFKFDGYWILSDAFGVHNLGRETVKVLKSLISALAGFERFKSPWPPLTSALLILYAGATAIVWSFFAIRVIKALGAQLHVILMTVMPVWSGGHALTGVELRHLGFAIGGALLTMYLAARILRRGLNLGEYVKLLRSGMRGRGPDSKLTGVGDESS